VKEKMITHLVKATRKGSREEGRQEGRQGGSMGHGIIGALELGGMGA